MTANVDQSSTKQAKPRAPKPGPPRVTPLALVVDYQNMHLTGHDMFGSERRKSDTSISPGLLARALMNARDQRQQKLNRARGTDPAIAARRRRVRLERVEVYRGLPSIDYQPRDHARNIAQKQYWESWEGQGEVAVTHRDLVYPRVPHEYNVDYDGRHTGKIDIALAREKGVDVLCAMALVRLARQLGPHGVVVLASRDRDLAPALDEAMSAPGSARIETVAWDGSGCLKPAKKCWTNYLSRENFLSCIDDGWTALLP